MTVGNSAVAHLPTSGTMLAKLRIHKVFCCTLQVLGHVIVNTGGRCRAQLQQQALDFHYLLILRQGAAAETLFLLHLKLDGFAG